MEMSGYFHAPVVLLLEISQLYTRIRKLGWILSRSVRRGREKFCCPCRIRTTVPWSST